MEEEGDYSIPGGIQLASFCSVSSVSKGSAATGGTNSEEKERTEKLEKEIGATRESLFQLGNYYLVFQGVIFTAIFSSPSHIKCQYRWLPVTLSLIAGLFNIAILMLVKLKHDQLKHERELDLAAVGSRPVPSYLEDKHENRRLISMFCVATLVVFQIILLIGSWNILCPRSHYSQNYNIKDCFELCNDYGRCSFMCLSP